MQMTKQVESCPASAIVQFRMGQYSQEGTLANVCIAQDSQAQVNELRTERTTLYMRSMARRTLD